MAARRESSPIGRLGSSGPVAFVERQLESLSPRDRKLLVGLVVVLCFIFVGMLWWSLYGVLEEKASRVRSAKTKLETIQVLQAEYLEADGEIERQESRLSEYKGKRVSAYIEEVASSRGVLEQLRSVNEAGTEQVGTIKQSKYRIELKRIDYQAAFGFIYELETSGFPTHVDMAQFRIVNSREGKTLDVTLELTVYSLAES